MRIRIYIRKPWLALASHHKCKSYTVGAFISPSENHEITFYRPFLRYFMLSYTRQTTAEERIAIMEEAGFLLKDFEY